MKGALVTIENGKIVSYGLMPTLADKKFLDFSGLARMIRKSEADHCFLERVHAFPKAAAGSTFTFGSGFGALQGILCTLEMQYTLVPPQQWQKEMHQGVENKFDPKHRSSVAALRLFPGFDFTLGNKRRSFYHDGVVDAALIALYGLRFLTNSVLPQ